MHELSGADCPAGDALSGLPRGVAPEKHAETFNDRPMTTVDEREEALAALGGRARCKDCKKFIDADANVCAYCGSRILAERLDVPPAIGSILAGLAGLLLGNDPDGAPHIARGIQEIVAKSAHGKSKARGAGGVSGGKRRVRGVRDVAVADGAGRKRRKKKPTATKRAGNVKRKAATTRRKRKRAR